MSGPLTAEGPIPRVSFIIPHWNHRQLLAECIASIGDTAGELSREVIVVDNASSDDSAAYVRENFPEVMWIQNDTNSGYAKAVNQGVERARGSLLFLLNNDVRLMEHCTQRLMGFLAAHPRAGAVAPLLCYPDGRTQVSCRRFPTPSALLLEFLGTDRVGPFRRWKLREEEHVSAGMVPQPMASALMVKRECWEGVGPLDEAMPLYFNDVDWCYRLYRDTPWQIFLVPEARAFHHGGASAGRLGVRRKIAFYRGLARFYRKHFPFSAGSASA